MKLEIRINLANLLILVVISNLKSTLYDHGSYILIEN